MIRVLQVGLGPIGLSVTRYLFEHARLLIVGGVDIDPAMQGKDVGELAGLDNLGVAVNEDLSPYPSDGVNVAVVTTTSSLERTSPLLFELLERGWNIVSTCEELSFPWLAHPELSRQLDAESKRQGVSILGTGINPGFLMDLLPIVMSGVCSHVEKVQVERVQDACLRRVPFQLKIGAGKKPGEFRDLVSRGLLGHVGLTESLHMVAGCLGWTLDRTTDEIEPVVATSPFLLIDREIPAGRVSGLQQIGSGMRGGHEVIRLVFRANMGEPRSFDRIRMFGTPPIDFLAEGGINGDVGTIAITVNSIPVLCEARPGLLSMADLPPVTWLDPTGG